MRAVSILLVCGGGLVKSMGVHRSVMSRVGPFPDEPHCFYFAKDESCSQISSITYLPRSDRPTGHPSSNTQNVQGEENER